MQTPCFLVHETDRVQRFLRRFTFATQHACPKASTWGCNARVWIEEHPAVKADDGYYDMIDPDTYRGDPRWPAVCDLCKQPFPPKAQWQVNQEPFYERRETGERWRECDLPPGAMYNAWWNPPEWSGSDGQSLVCVLPDQVHWTMDCPSKDGRPWQRTGVAPLITATPSILTKGYHGWLRNGILVSC